MDVLEAIKERRSIRKYEPKAVPEEKLTQILEAGRWAPSAGNSQPWQFIVVRDEEVKNELARVAAYGRFLAEAPLSILHTECSKRGSWKCSRGEVPPLSVPSTLHPGDTLGHQSHLAVASVGFVLAPEVCDLGQVSECQARQMITVTLDRIEDKRIANTLGLLKGSIIRARHLYNRNAVVVLASSHHESPLFPPCQINHCIRDSCYFWPRA